MACAGRCRHHRGAASRARGTKWRVCAVASEREQDLDRPTLIRGLVALGCLVEGKREVEHLAGVDLAVPDELDQSGKNRRTGAGPPWAWMPAKNSLMPGIVTS